MATRGDVANAFDHITYEKGATVIGMFEAWIGEEAFRRGVHDYLDARREGSATSVDFLAALSTASMRPVAPAFESFLGQGGIPLVETRLQCGKGGARLDLRQRRLTLVGAAPSGPQRWQIPLCAKLGGMRSSKQFCTLLSGETASIPLGDACPAFVLANAGGVGYFVADYRDGALERLERHRNALTAAEFASLLDDLRALVRAGSVNHAQALRWVQHGAAHRDRHVLRAAVDLAQFEADVGVTEDGGPAFERFVRTAFGPRARALGFVPRAGEGDDDQLMRRTLLRFAAPYDPALAREARRLALAWTRDRTAIAPGLVDVTLITAARTGDAALFDALLAAARSTTDRDERRYLTMALVSFNEPALAQKGLRVLLDPSFDVRESWTAVWNTMGWQPSRRATNDFVMANFDALAKTVSPYAPSGWPKFAAGLCSARDRAAVQAFWQPRVAKIRGRRPRARDGARIDRRVHPTAAGARKWPPAPGRGITASEACWRSLSGRPSTPSQDSDDPVLHPCRRACRLRRLREYRCSAEREDHSAGLARRRAVQPRPRDDPRGSVRRADPIRRRPVGDRR